MATGDVRGMRSGKKTGESLKRSSVSVAEGLWLFGDFSCEVSWLHLAKKEKGESWAVTRRSAALHLHFHIFALISFIFEA